MRTGCVVAATVLVLLLGIGGYIGYIFLRDNLNIPEELAPYTSSDSITQLVRSQAAAPSDTAHLTREQVEMFVGALDSLNAGWHNLNSLFDSLGRQNMNGSRLDIWHSPKVLREIIMLPVLTRKGLVSYLNARNLSLAQYQWLKERTVAASGITHQEISIMFRDSINRYLPVPDSSPIHSTQIIAFFARIGQIRNSGLIDSSDIALVAPYRQLILHNGIGAFINAEAGDEHVHAAISIK